VKKNLNLYVALVCCALILTALPAAAAKATFDVDRPGVDAPPWVPVAEGVWQRTYDNGRVSTRVEGKAGLAWALPSLRHELQNLSRAFLDNPSSDLEAKLDSHLAVIEHIEAVLGVEAPASDLQRTTGATTSCSRTFSIAADAFPYQCGARGTSSAAYSTNCTEQCTVYASALARRTCNHTTYQDSQYCTDTGTNVSCSATATETGALNSCYSEGYAYIYCPALNNLFIDEFDSNTSCFAGQICAACAIDLDDR
jgi:hypothetical protein